MTIPAEERDLLIRTVIGESRGEPLEGQAAVAHVILNRALQGKFGGSTIRDVVMAPKQFEPWSTRKDELMAISPDSKVYQETGALVDSILAGKVPDVTGGATHFANEEIVRQRRGGSVPKWMEKMAPSAQRIGRHTFYGGQGWSGGIDPSGLPPGAAAVPASVRVADAGTTTTDAADPISSGYISQFMRHGPLSKEMVEAEMRRRGMEIPGSQPQFTKEELEAEMRRRGLEIPGAPAPAAPAAPTAAPPAAPAPNAMLPGIERLTPENFNPMLPGMPTMSPGIAAQIDPMTPGLSAPGGDPVGAMTDAAAGWANEFNAALQGVQPMAVKDHSPVGRIERIDGKVMLWEPDSPPKELPPSEFGKYVTLLQPDGSELLYLRTPDMEESAAASAGRALGAGFIGPVAGTSAVPRASKAASDAARGATAARDLGITPSLGMMGPASARIASVAEGNLLTANRAGKDAARALDEIVGVKERIASTAGDATSPFQAGSVLQDAANAYADIAVRGKDTISGRLNGTVNALMDGKRVPMTKTSGLLQEYVSALPENMGSTLRAGKWKGWLDDIAANGGSLTWEQARQIRTAVGEGVGKISGPMSDISGSQLKRIYDAVTTDLEAAAHAAGPRASQAWDRANDFHRRASDKIDGALKFLFDEKSPENAYARFMDLTTKGRSADIEKLKEIKRSVTSVDPDAWGAVASTVIRQMGKATPGGQNAAGDAFSAATFLTEWSKMSPEAKQALFSGKGVPEGLLSELNKLADVAEAAKAAGIERNVSRSGVNVQNFLTGSALAFGDLTSWVGATAGVLSHRAVTNPAFLRWWRNRVAVKGPSKWGARGMAIARKYPELAPDVQAVMRISDQELGQGAGSPAPQARMLPAPGR